MEDTLLKQARALYNDRLRIALAALIIVFFVTFYIFYSPEIITLGATPPPGIDYSGWTQGFAVVASVNTVGFFSAIALMALICRFWSWAFLPGPASTYTLAVLEGIFSSKVTIKHSFGKRFKVMLENGLQFDVNCSIKEKNTGEWFVYRLMSTQLQCSQLRNIALRHGFGVKNDRIVGSVSNDELHHRTILLTKAMMLANSFL